MSKETSSSQPITSQGDIVVLAQQYVLSLYNQKNDARLLYHSYRQTSEIARTVNLLAEANASVKDDWELAELGAWFVNVGYLVDHERPARKSIEVAEKFLNAHQYPEAKKKRLLELLREVLVEQEPTKPAAQLLLDAINSVRFGTKFLENAELLRAEMDLLNKDDNSPALDMDEWLLKQLMDVHFYTPHGKVNFEPIVASHLLDLRRKLNEKERSADVKAEPDGSKEKKTEGDLPVTRETEVGFWFINYHNHLRLTALADNKAHAMIGINALLIILVIGLTLFTKASGSATPLLIPTFLFITAALGSTICALMAVKPRVTSVVHEATALDEAKRNMLFFGNFVSLTAEKFEQLLTEVLGDKDLMQHNFVTDLYHLGKVLDEKYRYLSYCYAIFMLGFGVSALAFLLVLVV